MLETWKLLTKYKIIFFEDPWRRKAYKKTQASRRKGRVS